MSQRIIIVGYLMLAALFSADAADLILAENGKAALPISLGPNPAPDEEYAAQELARCLNALSGATFEIRKEPRPQQEYTLSLSYDPMLRPEESLIETTERQLVIRGGRPRGLLYGVYRLLDEKFGCRWYTPDIEVLPKRERLTLPSALRERWSPPLEYREPYCTEAWNGDWAARNRMNGASMRLGEKHGGKVTYGKFVHTFENILSADKEFEAHPEYFSWVKGKRLKQHTQLCLTNAEVQRIAIETVKRWIRENPEARIFSVSQNDWFNPCECDGCKAIDDAEGSHAGTMIQFVNTIAAAIEKDHPHVAIDTLAYQYTRKPPKTMVPRANVIVRLCSIECCFAHSFDSCSEQSNTSFMADLKGWNKLTKRLYVWDYITNFSHYLVPFPNLDALDRNVRTLTAHGVVGLFEQGNYSSGGGGELAELRAWVLARLMLDPRREGDTLIREFVQAVYGPAAEPVQQFLDLSRTAIRGSGEHLRINDGVVREYLSVEILKQSAALLERAAEIAAKLGDAKLQARIKRLQMPVWYTRVWQGREDFETVLKPSARQLLDAVRELKVTHLREHTPVADEIKRLELLVARRVPPPAPTQGVAAEDFAFRISHQQNLAALVPDELAEDGGAAWQPGSTREWSVAWDLPKDLPAGRTYVVRVRVRVDKKGEAGPAFHIGVYDTATRKGLGEARLQAKDVPHNQYRWYTVAEIEPRSSAYVYVAPDANEANVTAIYTDRIELIPKN